MPYILVRHKVKDYEQFRKVFFKNFKEVKDNDSQRGHIFRNKVDPNEVFVLVKWNNLDNFKTFYSTILGMVVNKWNKMCSKVGGQTFDKFSESSPKESKEKAGIIGESEGWFFEEVEEFSE